VRCRPSTRGRFGCLLDQNAISWPGQPCRESFRADDSGVPRSRPAHHKEGRQFVCHEAGRRSWGGSAFVVFVVFVFSGREVCRWNSRCKYRGRPRECSCRARLLSNVGSCISRVYLSRAVHTYDNDCVHSQ
jgi:hypothetical protein